MYRTSKKKTLKKATGTSEVYEDTTAPLDEESKGMLKSGQNGTEQVEMEVRVESLFELILSNCEYLQLHARSCRYTLQFVTVASSYCSVDQRVLKPVLHTILTVINVLYIIMLLTIYC